MLTHRDISLLVQAINGGKPTWFGIEVPFDLNTLLAIVSIESEKPSSYAVSLSAKRGLGAGQGR